MKIDVPCLTLPGGLSRRIFLRIAASTTAGLAGVLATDILPLYAATRTLTMLTWNHFVSALDETLRRLARSFGKANKCQVKIDCIAPRDTYVKVAKEYDASIRAKAGQTTLVHNTDARWHASQHILGVRCTNLLWTE